MFTGFLWASPYQPAADNYGKKNTEIFEKMKHSCPSPPRVKASGFILRCKEVVKKIHAKNCHLLQQATTPGNPTVSISIKHIKRIL